MQKGIIAEVMQRVDGSSN